MSRGDLRRHRLTRLDDEPEALVPGINMSSPSGASPYSPEWSSRSVPSSPTRRTRTRTPRPSDTSPTDGVGASIRRRERASPGRRARAFHRFTPRTGARPPRRSPEGGRSSRRPTAGGEIRRLGACTLCVAAALLLTSSNERLRRRHKARVRIWPGATLTDRGHSRG
jgi:hypothetical protein